MRSSIMNFETDQDLGEVYYFGVRNVERNAIVAAKHFRVAAESGNLRAMGMLGHLYARGHGVQTDALRAYSAYYEGAEEGKYLSEGAAREWSTVVIVIVIFMT